MHLCCPEISAFGIEYFRFKTETEIQPMKSLARINKFKIER